MQLLPVYVYMAPTSADCHSVLHWSIVNAVDNVNKEWPFSLGVTVAFSLYSDIHGQLYFATSFSPTPRSCTHLQGIAEQLNFNNHRTVPDIGHGYRLSGRFTWRYA